MALAIVLEVPVQTGGDRDAVVAAQDDLASPCFDFEHIQVACWGNHLENEAVGLCRNQAFEETSCSRDGVDGVAVVPVGENWEETVASLREESGKDIWLFGGGQLFQSLLAASLVDTVEIAVVPVLLGGGIEMLRLPVPMQTLELTNQRVYNKSGIVLLEYAVTKSSARSHEGSIG